MKVVIIGDGAREHAMAHVFVRHGFDTIVVPGNDGMKLAGITVKNVDVSNIETLVSVVLSIKPDIVIVGPTEYMIRGVVDKLLHYGSKVIGATSNSSLLEADKSFAKEFMKRYNIPTPRFRIVHTISQLERALKSFSSPYVIKVPTLQGGKGSFILPSLSEALEIGGKIITSGFKGMISEGLVIEEYVAGEEYAVQVLVSGGEYIILPMVWEYQRLYDDGRGPNTGGMGAVAPINIDKTLFSAIEEVVARSIRAMLKEGISYEGFLYLGVMVTSQEISVLEYNVRLGDPETEVVVSIDEEGFIRMIKDTAFGRLPEPLTDKRIAVAVSLVSENAPFDYTPAPIYFSSLDNVFFDHVKIKEGILYVSGWRPVVVVGTGKTYKDAIRRAYKRIEDISFDGMMYRKDIGRELT